MTFTLPEARRERMEQLLEYLGDTSRYSEYYSGNRVEDFKKCFDIESEWCWKYADLVLRGMEKRELEYAEVHHVVPMAFYRRNGRRNASSSRAMTLANTTTLTYSEHLYVHYCAAFAAKEEFADKMGTAFQYMYYNGFRGKNKGRFEFPTEEEFTAFIPTAEVVRAICRREICATVDADGRTHSWEDPVKAKRESAFVAYWRNPEAARKRSRESSKEKYDTDPEYRDVIKERSRTYRRNNPEKSSERNRKYRCEHKDELSAKSKTYYENNKEVISEKNRKYRSEHREELNEKDRERRKIMGDVYNANRREKRANDPEWREMNNARRREKRKNDVQWRKHECEVRCARYARQHPDMKPRVRYSSPEESASMHRVKNRENYRKNMQDPEFRKLRNEKRRQYDAAKRAAGYKHGVDPVTGKRVWVFVGLPEQEVAA